MTTIQDIQKQITNKQEILEHLGYSNIKLGIKTLDSLLNSNSIIEWLQLGHYDFKYSSEEFLYYLFQLLGFYDLKEIIDKSKNFKSLENSRIIIQTNFKRTNESITILSLASSLLNIKINKSILLNLTFKEEKELIYETINNHFKETNGELKLWGKIISYSYYSEIHKREIVVFK